VGVEFGGELFLNLGEEHPGASIDFTLGLAGAHPGKLGELLALGAGHGQLRLFSLMVPLGSDTWFHRT
jgi:hypothetical protein